MIVLTPKQGYHYKDKASGDIYEYQLYLGKEDSESNYELVTDEEYQTWLKSKEPKLEEQAK